MARALALIVVAGAGYYAYSQGWLDQVVAEVQESLARDNFNSATRPGEAEPTLAAFPVPAANLTHEENLLNQHAQWVSGYAADNPELAAAIMWQESRGRASAVSHVGALGLMQVMPATARDLYDNFGYQRLSPTRNTLLTPEGSIYFGTAYMEWLNRIRRGRTWEWYIRAYNGGPSGAETYMGGGKNSENDGYYTAVWNRWNYLTNRIKGEMA